MSEALEATVRILLREHYKAAAYWSQKSDRRGKGYWRCACGQEGEPIGRSITDGHRAHVAAVIARAATYGQET